MIDIENKVFKVTCWNDENLCNYIPKDIRVKTICNQLEDLKCVKYLGKSSIDGFPLYTIDKLILRSIKINQLMKKSYKYKTVIDTLDNMSNSIQISCNKNDVGL